MTTIGFHGASGMVTGSCYEVKVGSSQPVLIDCGMYQGVAEIEELNREPLGFDPSYLAGVILTHAHLDHCGRLPLLVQGGFSGPVFTTQATRDLLELTLHDAARIQTYDREETLFTEEEVVKLLSLVRIVPYHESFSVGDHRAELVDAGHILGSSSVILKHKDERSTLLFSGDLGNSPQDLIRPTEYLKRGEVVVMESTYGDKDHPDEDPANLLAALIQEVEKGEGTLLVPAFSLERTQEVLHMIDHLKKDGRVANETAVFLDSPMAIKATRIFKKFTPLYNQELKTHARQDDPFDFPGLRLTMRGHDSKQIYKHMGPKVIIAGSGMMTGGRILHHATHYLKHDNTILVFIGYQAVETLGRTIQEGAIEVLIEGKVVPVNAKIETISALSSHAGQMQLASWLEHINGVRRVFLTHGDKEPRKILKETLHRRHTNLDVQLPTLHQTVSMKSFG